MPKKVSDDKIKSHPNPGSVSTHQKTSVTGKLNSETRFSNTEGRSTLKNTKQEINKMKNVNYKPKKNKGNIVNPEKRMATPPKPENVDSEKSKEEYIAVEKYEMLTKKFEEYIRNSEKQIEGLKQDKETFRALFLKSDKHRESVEEKSVKTIKELEGLCENTKIKLMEETKKHKQCKRDLEECKKSLETKLQRKFEDWLASNKTNMDQLTAKILIQSKAIKHSNMKLEHAKLHNENLKNKLCIQALGTDERIEIEEIARCTQSL